MGEEAPVHLFGEIAQRVRDFDRIGGAGFEPP
jgi:hypothetical protein